MIKKILYSCLFLLGLQLHAQTDYQAEWEKIDKLREEEGNHKSLRPLMQNIFQQAQKEHNTPNKIRALLELSQLSLLIDDEDISEDSEPEIDIVKKFREEIEHSKGTEKKLLQNYLAKVYAQYITNNYYDYQDITKTENTPDDYRQWSSLTLHQEIEKLYKSALSDDELLKKELTKDWSELVINSENPEFRPTLYDLVQADYIAFLDNANLYKQDSLRAIIKSEKEKIVQFHQSDNDKTAFLYAKRNLIEGSVLQQMQAIEQLANEYRQTPYSAYLQYEVASFWNSTDTINHYIKARDICKKTIESYADSNPWRDNCKSLIKNLEQKYINLSIPKTYLPNQYIPLNIAYKNVNEFSIDIVKLSGLIDINDKKAAGELQITNNSIEKSHSELSKKVYQKETYKVKNFSDLDMHYTLLALPPLPKGTYEVLMQNNSKKIIISDLYTVLREEDDEQTVIQFLNTKTGKAITNQNVKLYQRRYDNKESKYVIETKNKLMDII